MRVPILNHSVLDHIDVVESGTIMSQHEFTRIQQAALPNSLNLLATDAEARVLASITHVY